MADLLVIVPTRGRPESVARVVDAWEATGAFAAGAELCFVIDCDDPHFVAYRDGIVGRYPGDLVRLHYRTEWQPMVHKLNAVAGTYATDRREHWALGFAGDDHLPRTPGWAGRYLAALRELGTGIAYGDDGFQGPKLPTQWAMTADIVRALGRMVPAPVEHMYCDNSIMEIGQQAGCLCYLPDVLIEHMHPLAAKAEWDDGYRRVNQAAQYERDRAAYRRWRTAQMAMDAGIVRTLREKRHEHAH